MKKIIADELLEYFCKKNPIMDGEELLICDEKIFGDDEEHEINFYYGDGFAISEDMQYFMTYPKVKHLTKEQKRIMDNYQGFGMPRIYTKRDCALTFGKFKKF